MNLGGQEEAAAAKAVANQCGIRAKSPATDSIWRGTNAASSNKDDGNIQNEDAGRRDLAVDVASPSLNSALSAEPGSGSNNLADAAMADTDQKDSMPGGMAPASNLAGRGEISSATGNEGLTGMGPEDGSGQGGGGLGGPAAPPADHRQPPDRFLDATPSTSEVRSAECGVRNSGPRNLGSDYARDKADWWKQLWQAWGELQQRQPGISRREAAELLGVGQVTLWRLEKTYAKRGFEARTDECGRNSQWEYLVDQVQQEQFRQKLTEIYLATVGAGSANMTRGRRTAKMALALQSMAEEPECPKELAARLRRGNYPVCLLRYLRRITPELENRLRGPKHFQLNGLNSRRDQTIRFEDGTRGEMPAGFKWVFDDMSSNQPFYAGLAAGQILFSRQGLYAIDERSLRWLGKMLVARPREAYRAEDILRFLRSLMEVYGKPDMIVFELSVWASRKIRGFRITETQAVIEEEFERPEMPERERQDLQRGLEAIGVRLVFAHSAHGKIIETAFNYLQDVLAVKTREFVNVGRHAGEFESSAKRVRQVRAFQAGIDKIENRRNGAQTCRAAMARTRGPGELGFAPMEELSERIDQAFAFINGRVNSRGEVPDEVWARDCGSGIENEKIENGRDGVGAGSGGAGSDGAGTDEQTRTDTGRRPLAGLEPDDYAAFLPELRERTIDGGRVSVQVDGVTHDFRAPWMIELGSGFKVYLKFDSMEMTRGAAVYSREGAGAPANIHGWRVGKFIGWAVWEMPGPAADVIGDVRGVERKSVEEFYGQGAFDNGDNLRRKQGKAVATAFSALPRPGQPAVKSVKTGASPSIENGRIENRTGGSGQGRAGRMFVRPSEEERKERANSFARLAELARSSQTANITEGNEENEAPGDRPMRQQTEPTTIEST